MIFFVKGFFSNDEGDHESTRVLDNAKLELPQEDLDERTVFAKGMMEQGYAAKVFAKATSG